jgi:thymidylate kinase
MLIYLEGLDKSGKSTLAGQVSARLHVPIYRKLPPANLNLPEHHSYFKGVGFAVMELHNLFGFSAIVDRSFISDWVYTNRNSDVCPIHVWREWEARHVKEKGVVVVYVDVPLEILKARLVSAPDPYMSLHDIIRFRSLYEAYMEQTTFRVVRVSGIASADERMAELESIRQATSVTLLS